MTKWIVIITLCAVAFVAWLKYEPKPIAVHTTFNAVKCSSPDKHHYLVRASANYDSVALCTIPTLKSGIKTLSDRPVCRLYGGKLTCEECDISSGNCTQTEGWTMSMLKTKEDTVYGQDESDSDTHGLLTHKTAASTKEPYESQVYVSVHKTPPQVMETSTHATKLENFTQDDLPMGLSLHSAPVCMFSSKSQNCYFYFKTNNSPDLYVSVMLFTDVDNEKITDGRDVMRAYDFWKPYIQKSFVAAKND